MAGRISSSRLYKFTVDEYLDAAQASRERDRQFVERVRARDAAGPGPAHAPRAPEWVYRRLAGLPVEVPEETYDDDELSIEARIEHSSRHSLDGYDDQVTVLG